MLCPPFLTVTQSVNCAKYLSHHIGVQRLISLNSMRIIIAIFEDIPVLILNMSLLLQKPYLATNKLFMASGRGGRRTKGLALYV